MIILDCQSCKYYVNLYFFVKNLHYHYKLAIYLEKRLSVFFYKKTLIKTISILLFNLELFRLCFKKFFEKDLAIIK